MGFGVLYTDIYFIQKKPQSVFFFFSFFLFGVNSLLFIFLEPHLYMLLVDQSQIHLKGNSTVKAIYSNQPTSPFHSETLERWTGGYVYLFGSYIFERLLEVASLGDYWTWIWKLLLRSRKSHHICIN